LRLQFCLKKLKDFGENSAEVAVTEGWCSITAL